MGINDGLPREKNIVLIGFMGVGKTTIGKALARKINRGFIDIDHEIEKEYKLATTEIFRTFGEKSFREKEKVLIAQYCKQKNKVISLGGGAFLQEETRKICLSESIVFHLDLSWESWQERISLLIDSRPVLQGKKLDEIKELFYKRKKIYADHHVKVKIDNLTIEEVTEIITDSLKTVRDANEPRHD